MLSDGAYVLRLPLRLYSNCIPRYIRSCDVRMCNIINVIIMNKQVPQTNRVSFGKQRRTGILFYYFNENITRKTYIIRYDIMIKRFASDEYRCCQNALFNTALQKCSLQSHFARVPTYNIMHQAMMMISQYIRLMEICN